MSNFALRLHAYQNNLSDKENKLAKYLLTNQTAISHSTISELSAQTGISTATISRFAKNLGFTNFQDLKLNLVQTEAEDNLLVEIDPDDSPKTIAEKTFASNIDALKATENTLNNADLVKCVDLILQAKHLGLFGLGASNVVALDGYHKFLRTSIDVIYVEDFHMQLMNATRLTASDVMLLISHSGENRDAIALAKLAKARHTPIILITSSANSTLANIADVKLVSIAEESMYRTEALHALIAQISIIDALFMMTAIKTDRKIALEIRQEIEKTRSK